MFLTLLLRCSFLYQWWVSWFEYQEMQLVKTRKNLQKIIMVSWEGEIQPVLPSAWEDALQNTALQYGQLSHLGEPLVFSVLQLFLKSENHPQLIKIFYPPFPQTMCFWTPLGRKGEEITRHLSLWTLAYFAFDLHSSPESLLLTGTEMLD